MPGRLEMPDAIEKRNILASQEVEAEDLNEYGRMFLEKDMLTDAFNFFEKSGSREGLERVKARVIEEGLTAVLFNLARSGHIAVSDEDWRAAGEKAMKLEKFTYAAQAFDRIGDEERLAEARQNIPGAPQPGPAEEENDEEQKSEEEETENS